MMSDIVAVLFDWAGTMIDFGSRAPVMAMEQVFEKAGVPADETTIRRYMGMAKREHVVSILSEDAMAARWQAAKGSAWSEADVDALMVDLEPAMATSAALCRELIPGAATTASALKHKGIKVGSTTGYTRTMMADIIPAAADQGYAPAAIVCAGETALGRPAPLMLWQAMAELSAWPAGRCVAVDDAPVGIVAGRNAGLWTIGVAGSGNGVGMTYDDFMALAVEERAERMAPVVDEFAAAGADFVVESVADLCLAIRAIEEALTKGDQPGAAATRMLAGQPT
ncbi:phosphonoacetaldehyde hydrolase [uncultured Sphingobium sp.]|uniref:phosphonoacetaldehyde hydrolase n=1 Tax=uncultured Sphingobium sp. TaxID=316087 RepID=UPI002603083B|nr:phosphonoacetaldehyde hydrolase [uncultured Sphingobium sp.]